VAVLEGEVCVDVREGARVLAAALHEARGPRWDPVAAACIVAGHITIHINNAHMEGTITYQNRM
jgi:hypothetical protein